MKPEVGAVPELGHLSVESKVSKVSLPSRKSHMPIDTPSPFRWGDRHHCHVWWPVRAVQVPSGKHTKNDGKSPCLMGKFMKIHYFYGHLAILTEPEDSPKSPISSTCRTWVQLLQLTHLPARCARVNAIRGKEGRAGRSIKLARPQLLDMEPLW